MDVERSRITLLAGGAAFAVTLAARVASAGAASPLPPVVVYKSPT
jgi:hypothetical protein